MHAVKQMKRQESGALRIPVLERGLPRVSHCHWETFHTCATAALSECQEEAGKIWETLKEESKKIRFQGSLFDLCSPNTAPRLMGLIRSGNFLVLFPATLVWLAL
ncbi:NRN1 protein, partial [Polypterus senegalus]